MELTVFFFFFVFFVFFFFGLTSFLNIKKSERRPSGHKEHIKKNSAQLSLFLTPPCISLTPADLYFKLTRHDLNDPKGSDEVRGE